MNEPASQTPRTDAETYRYYTNGLVIMVEPAFARTLELELNQSRQALDDARKEIEELKKVRIVRDRIQELTQRCAKLEKALKAQKDYSDYLIEAVNKPSVYLEVHGWKWENGFLKLGENLREAIKTTVQALNQQPEGGE